MRPDAENCPGRFASFAFFRSCFSRPASRCRLSSAATAEISNGLAIKSLAPSLIDSKAISTEPCAVIKINGKFLSNFRKSRTTDKPSPSGIKTSHKTASKLLFGSSAQASRPDSALDTRKPLSDKPVSSVSRIAGSSSTIKMCGFSVIGYKIKFSAQAARLIFYLELSKLNVRLIRLLQFYLPGANGRKIVNFEPLFNSLSTSMRPPCSSTISCVNAKPKPVPATSDDCLRGGTR